MESQNNILFILFLINIKNVSTKKNIAIGVVYPRQIYLSGKHILYIYNYIYIINFYFLIFHTVALYGKQTCYLHYLFRFLKF